MCEVKLCPAHLQKAKVDEDVQAARKKNSNALMYK